MNYDQAKILLDDSILNASKNGLPFVSSLLAAMGSPQRNFRMIHITGTNGKGSTAAMLSSILRRTGRRVGLFTSPHLSDLRERIRVDGRPIARKAVCAILGELLGGAKEAGSNPTFFEIMTVMAAAHFAAEKCDIAIFEVGLGGRLDPTNALDGDVCAITGIDLDHTELLGPTREDIAREKVAIVKKGAALVANVADRALFGLIEGRALGAGAVEVTDVAAKMTGRVVASSTEGLSFVLDGFPADAGPLSVPLVGDYQFENARTALAVIDAMRRLGIADASPDDIREGLDGAKWPGRFEIFGKRSPIVLDGAHNASGMAGFTRNLGTIFPGRRIRSVVGILKSKDYAKMLDSIAAVSDEIILTGLDNPKKRIEVGYMLEYASRVHDKVKAFPDARSALDYAAAVAARGDVTCVTGSLYLVGEARELLADGRRKSAARKKGAQRGDRFQARARKHRY